MSLWRRPAYWTHQKALDITNAMARVAPDLLKNLAIVSDTTARRSGVEQEDLKSLWESEIVHISGEHEQAFNF